MLTLILVRERYNDENKTIIGLKYDKGDKKEKEQADENKTIIGLKFF